GRIDGSVSHAGRGSRPPNAGGHGRSPSGASRSSLTPARDRRVGDDVVYQAGGHLGDADTPPIPPRDRVAGDLDPPGESGLRPIGMPTELPEVWSSHGHAHTACSIRAPAVPPRRHRAGRGGPGGTYGSTPARAGGQCGSTGAP